MTETVLHTHETHTIDLRLEIKRGDGPWFLWQYYRDTDDDRAAMRRARDGFHKEIPGFALRGEWSTQVIRIETTAVVTQTLEDEGSDRE